MSKQKWNVLDSIVIPFVAKFDVPFRYDVGIGKLWQSGCFQQSHNWSELANKRLAEFVGGSYCCMIREDVNYRLPEGLRVARRSQAAANELRKRLQSAKNQNPKYLYASVRWHDAFGRLLYRTGNYSLARIEFQTCMSLIGKRERCYWYWPDIRSNLARTELEIAQQVNDHREKAWDSYSELVDAARFAIDRQAKEKDKNRKKELCRGIVSSLHNSLWCRRHISDETLHIEENQSTLLGIEETLKLITKYVRKDIYREAQFTNVRAAQEKNKRKRIAEYKVLLESDWLRGQFIAKQNLASLKNNFHDLLELCEEIESELSANGGFDVLDIDRFDWTLSLTESVAANSKSKIPNRDLKRLARQQEAITEAVSSVISIATYRERFEKKIRKRLRRIAGERLGRVSRRKRSKDAAQELDELVDQLEVFGAKEVLEVLRFNRSKKRVGLQSSDLGLFLVPAGRTAKSTKLVPQITPNDRGTQLTSMAVLPVANISIAQSRKIHQAAQEAREADERFWLDNPLSIRTSLDSPSQRARQVSLASPGQLFVRYGIHINPKTGREQLSAFWWLLGKAGFVSLPSDSLELARQFGQSKIPDDQYVEGLRQISRGKWESVSTGIPKLALAKRLWNAFLEPILSGLKSEFRDVDWNRNEIKKATMILDSELYQLPLNSAWVPSTCNSMIQNNVPLGMACDLAFSLNLTSHILDGRMNLANCIRHDEDELSVMYFDEHKDFERNSNLQQIRNVTSHWGRRGRFFDEAGKGDVKKTLGKRAEFLAFMCHGSCDKENGSMLRLKDCNLISHNLAYSAALHGNKLLVLGACESGSSKSDTYGKFIGAFIAAGAGAVLANPCSAYIATVCRVAAGVLEIASQSSQHPISLAAALRKSIQPTIDWIRERTDQASDEEVRLVASTYQLWL